MDYEEIVYKRRTIRRFKQKPISIDILKRIIDFARVAPAAKNIQALEFIIIQNNDICKNLFPLLSWASTLPKNERTPENGREPTAYIIVLVNTKIKRAYYDYDIGAAVENILLGAINFDLGACWMGSINRNKIKRLLEIPDFYEIMHVISLGYPDEKSVIEPFEGSFKYWKDKNGIMHIPKRNLKDIIFKII